MLGNLIMIGGIGLLSTSFVIRRKQNYFKEFYDDIQRSQKYHLDFVDDLTKVPAQKKIILFGPPKSETNPQKILCKSIIKKGFIQSTNNQSQQKKQFQFPKEDRLWKFSLKQPFYLQTLSNQKIIVEQDTTSQLYAFNLMRRKSNQLWEERVIVKNQPVCVYGKLFNSNGKTHFKASLIMGTKNENFLTFLDNQIIRLRNRGKIATYAGVGFFAIHMIYAQIFRQQKQTQKRKPLLTGSQDQKILQQIKEFEKNKK